MSFASIFVFSAFMFSIFPILMLRVRPAIVIVSLWLSIMSIIFIASIVPLITVSVSITIVGIYGLPGRVLVLSLLSVSLSISVSFLISLSIPISLPGSIIISSFGTIHAYRVPSITVAISAVILPIWRPGSSGIVIVSMIFWRMISRAPAPYLIIADSLICPVNSISRFSVISPFISV